MIKATEIMTYSMHVHGDKDGTVTRGAVRETILRYRDYLKEQDYIDKVFAVHDGRRRRTDPTPPSRRPYRIYARALPREVAMRRFCREQE